MFKSMTPSFIAERNLIIFKFISKMLDLISEHLQKNLAIIAIMGGLRVL